VIKSKRLPSSALARLQALPARAAALPGLDALWLFGSHARGDATPLSDVDLAYLEDLEAPRRDRTPAFDARIYDALSGFLGTDEISLVDLETAPPALALRVFREGKLLFCRNPRHVADVLERVLIRYPEVRRLIVQGLEGEERGAMEIDRDKVLAQLRLLDGDLRRLREKASLAAENYLADLDAQDAVLRRFQTAVEACSNIGNHLIARLRLRVAEDYAGVFTVLGEEGILGRELAARMAELARFRNPVVHMYWRVDHARVFSEMAERIRALEEFQDSVRRFLAPPGPQESKAWEVVGAEGGGESSGPTEASRLDWRREQSTMSFSVEDFHDLLRLLEERPEWRVEIRRVVLTEDLLRLPEELARARQETEQRFQEVAARIDALAARIDALAAQVSALTVRLEALTTQVSTLTGHVGTLRGESLEQRYRTRVFAYFGRLLRGAHALAPDELTALFEDAIAAAELSDEEAHEIALADVVVRGRRLTDGVSVYLVVEVSVSVGVGLGDVQRALRRAALLARTGVTALPVVAGEWATPEAADAAHAQRVWQITDGRVVAPEAPQA